MSNRIIIGNIICPKCKSETEITSTLTVTSLVKLSMPRFVLCDKCIDNNIEE